MGKQETGSRIDRSQVQKLRGEQGISAGTEKEKKEKTTGDILLQVVMAVIAVAYFVVLIFGKFFLPEDGEFMLSLNIFSDNENPNRLIRVISLAILTLSVSWILRFFISRMARNKTVTKRTGVAVIELLGNLVKYLAVVVLIFLILSALGVDTTELLAGLGVLSLILGLGVTSLVEDIVAGFFIIAERLFDVGDIVVVDEFRGTVQAIGIRSTQIVDEGGDVLILRNSYIGSLINMTSQMSYALCDIPISPLESYEHVEEIINNADFESMKEKYPEIEEGPDYLGLYEINDKGVMITTFWAGCQEGSKYTVQCILNRELKLLFERNGIKLGEPADDDDD